MLVVSLEAPIQILIWLFSTVPCLLLIFSKCCWQVRPLRRQLKGLKAWITGQRKDQSPGTRADIPIVQLDPAFEGVHGGPDSLVKFNPLSNMSSAEVWTFLRVMVGHTHFNA